MKRTPLYDEHVRSGARMVEFAGWEMPIQYKGVKEEHLHVRTQIGLFDVSHMGEIFFRGPKALDSLQWLTTNDVSKLEEGQAHYSLIPNDQGGLVDDIIVYCIKKNDDYLVCVNASNADKDFAWFTKHNKGADITNASEVWSQIAVQGKGAMELVEKILGGRLTDIKPFHHVEAKFRGTPVRVATTGYTGEKGCEIFVPNAQATALWQELIQQSNGTAQPIGLGARDTLRTEMAYSLYGNEIDDTSNPYAANLGWVVKPNAKDFMGKSLILNAKESGLKRKLVGFKMIDRGIPRHHYRLVNGQGQEVGIVTSGTHSPSLDEPIGIGYVSSELATEGTEIFVDIRGKSVKAKICKTPFVSVS
ncbi:MAG: glycine cleavage system aminomethyltransferase GcvT [Bdellovibrionota bacterium]